MHDGAPIAGLTPLRVAPNLIAVAVRIKQVALGVVRPLVRKPHVVPQFVDESAGRSNAEAEGRSGLGRLVDEQPCNAPGPYWRRPLFTKMQEDEVRRIGVAQCMHLVHVPVRFVRQTLQGIDCSPSYSVIHLGCGHKPNALCGPTRSVGFVGRCNIPIDQRAHGRNAALGATHERRIDNQQVDDAPVVSRGGGVRGWGGGIRTAKRRGA